MKEMEDNSVDFLLTDIPYNAVSRSSNGLRDLDKGHADTLNFDLSLFLFHAFRVTKGSLCVFCGNEQYSEIYDFFNRMSQKKMGTTRQIIWAKTNPSPMNGEYVYLNGTENAVWFRKRGATFNARCKKNVLVHPSGRRKWSPTEKPESLFAELVLDNTKEGDTVFDPCSGGGTTAAVCKTLHRNCIATEVDENQYNASLERLKI